MYSNFVRHIVINFNLASVGIPFIVRINTFSIFGLISLESNAKLSCTKNINVVVVFSDKLALENLSNIDSTLAVERYLNK